MKTKINYINLKHKEGNKAMNTQEALNVIKPKGNTQEALKTAYREACKKHHPDVNPNGLELMKVINIAYSLLKESVGKWSHEQNNNSDISITEQMQAIFDKIKFFENIKAEVCGTWLWVSGDTWGYRKKLKAAGMYWAQKKQQWYWKPVAEYKKRNKKVFSMAEIRNKYGSIELKQVKVAALSY